MGNKIGWASITYMYFQNFEYGDFKRLWVNEKHIVAGEEHVVRRGFVLECITGKEKKPFLWWTLNDVFHICTQEYVAQQHMTPMDL